MRLTKELSNFRSTGNTVTLRKSYASDYAPHIAAVASSAATNLLFVAYQIAQRLS